VSTVDAAVADTLSHSSFPELFYEKTRSNNDSKPHTHSSFPELSIITKGYKFGWSLFMI